MTILARIRAHGADVMRDGWNMRLLRASKLPAGALEWVKAHRNEVMEEIWPEFDAFEERAAIYEHEARMERAEAEAAAYREVMGEC
jgi:hypothetical protein